MKQDTFSKRVILTLLNPDTFATQLNYRNIYISYASSINKLSKPTMIPFIQLL